MLSCWEIISKISYLISVPVSLVVIYSRIYAGPKLPQRTKKKEIFVMFKNPPCIHSFFLPSSSFLYSVILFFLSSLLPSTHAIEFLLWSRCYSKHCSSSWGAGLGSSSWFPETYTLRTTAPFWLHNPKHFYVKH